MAKTHPRTTSGKIGSIFFKGLLTVLPVVLTIYLMVWLVQVLEEMFRFFLGTMLPTEWTFPGLSLLLGIGMIFVVGLLLQVWLVRWLWGFGESLLERIPLVQEIYTSIRQAFKYMVGQQGAAGQQVVMVSLENPKLKVLGLVTRTDLSDAPKGLGDDQTIAVYLPMSFQIGGYTAYVPKSSVEPVDMSPKDALRWTLMGAVSESDVKEK